MSGAARASRERGLKLLYLCHRLPYPPDKGCRIRAYHELVALAARHRIHLLSLADEPPQPQHVAALREVCAEVEVHRVERRAALLRAGAGLFGRQPLTVRFFHLPALAARVRELAAAEAFDAVVVYGSGVAAYAEPFAGVARVLDLVDVDSAKWGQYARFAPRPLRPVYALESRRLAAYEAELAHRFDRVVVATGQEARALAELAPGRAAAVVPNGVDLDYFRPLGLPKSDLPTLVFTGQMDYFANVDGIVHFARAVFPRLRRRFADLQLLVVGRAPVRAVRALGELPGVLVTGAVGDVRPFLDRAWVFVAPLRIAQGIQNKVLEAMAMELPVVATDRVHAGLSEGGFRDGRELRAAASDAELESAVARLLEAPAEREKLAAAARRRLVAAYRWDANMARFDELVRGAVERAGGRASLGRGARSA
ncbi:MAG TPA: TIGR03087 family PEP-CTERM/XrtA system glycosyltransferase [Thermoanaerobaculia bacterium]|nr:TIGR03087 family PEP-CTERM/XrtA system glycosyltransferase [Thermoanaerobaculia bacterium]